MLYLRMIVFYFSRLFACLAVLGTTYLTSRAGNWSSLLEFLLGLVFGMVVCILAIRWSHV